MNSNTYEGNRMIGVDSFNKVLYRLESDRLERKRLEKEYYEMFEPKLNFSGMFAEFASRGNRVDHTKFGLIFGLEKRCNL